jgi:hypothetical protein
MGVVLQGRETWELEEGLHRFCTDTVPPSIATLASVDLVPWGSWTSLHGNWRMLLTESS